MFGLLDSGSVVSILGRHIYKNFLKIGYPLYDDIKITVHAAGGQKLQSLGYMMLPLVFENQAHL